MQAASSNPNGRRAAVDTIFWVGKNAVGAGNAAASDLACFAGRAPIRLLAYLLVGSSFVLMMFPSIDLAVSGWFAAPVGGFPLSDDAMVTAIRDFNRLVPKLLLPALFLGVVWRAFRPEGTPPVAPHKALFVLAVYGLGGGVIVHGLKNLIGRARPDDILHFGGTDPFTVAWQVSSACLRNCSFSSGEAASAAAMLALAVLLPSRLRIAAILLLVPFAIAFSGARIAMGAHFFSDVIVSWLILLIVNVALWRIFRRHAADIDRAVSGCGLPLAAAAWSRLVALRRPREAAAAAGDAVSG